MNQTTNEKKIVQKVLKGKYEHLTAIEGDIVDVVRDTFQEIGSEVEQDNKVLVKNFGTFQQRKRLPRRRYDTGLKQAVITEPEVKVDFIQSNNIFRNEQEN